MNHRVFGKKLSRTTNERKRLRANLVRDLIIRGSITTTHAKAISARSLFERMVTQAKKGNASDLKEIRKVITDKEIFSILTGKVVNSLNGRNSGYTRILHMGVRRGDNAEMVRLEIVALAEPENAGPLDKDVGKNVKKIDKALKEPKKAGRPREGTKTTHKDKVSETVDKKRGRPRKSE